MIENIKISIMGEEKEVSKGTTYFELSKIYQPKFNGDILLVKNNNIYEELSKIATDNDNITFVDVSDPEGNRAYLSGLVFVTVVAAKEVFNKSNIVVKNSIDKGIYIETEEILSDEKVTALRNKMQELITFNLPFIKTVVERTNAIDYFNSIGDKSKASLLKYNTNTNITLYKLNNSYNYFFNNMPHNTGVLKKFEIKYLNEHGFILMYPGVFQNNTITEYVHHQQLFNVFNEYGEWAKMMKVSDGPSLNKVVSSGLAGNLIRMDETLQSNRLLNVAKDIYNRRNELKVVLIAGPTSSGKTTTCKKLSMYLKSFGINTKEISMDDYFVAREVTPKDASGEYNYETIDAVDLELFDNHVERIINGEEISTPEYDFYKGKSELTGKVQLEKDGILIIEGIHGLNPRVLPNIDKNKKYKIYISPFTGVHLDDHNRFSTSDNRLLRRIIRDNRTRGYSVEETLKRWQKVRSNEDEYIFKYQDEADCTFNTALIYELGVLKVYVEPLLYSVDVNSLYYSDAKRLINILKVFLPIASDAVPDDSLLREFIGGSCF